jgi:F0F1-type ATP synthase assembly protein I
MFAPIIAILVVFWVIGVATSHTLGGLVHLLPVAAVALVLARMIRKRRTDKAVVDARARKRKLMQRREGRT